MSNTGIFPLFHMRAVEDPIASKKAGCPKHMEVEYIEIRVAGDKNNVVNRKVRDEDIQRWPDQYRAFKAQQEQPISGTLIAEWPPITEAQKKDLLALNIKTVEALAELPDTGITRIGMGGREMVKKAQAYLRAAADGSEVMRLVEENEKLKASSEFMQQQINELKFLLEEAASSDEDKPKRRGRPRKSETEAA